MKVAFFTPVSPQKTGISDYTEQEILPYLSKFCDIDVFIDKNVKPSNSDLIKNFNIYSYTDFPSLEKNYDIFLYHMGNNSLHEFIYNTLMRHPGIVVLHDIFLHGFLWNISLSKGDAKNYIDTFEYCYGEKGVKIAQTAVITGVLPEFEYPLIKKIIDSSLGVICHSDYGITQIMSENKDSIVKKINQPYTIQDDERDLNYQFTTKSNLGLTKFFPIITSFGFIFPHKRYHIILKAFKRFLENYPDAILILVGEDMMNLNRMIADHGITKSVIQTGYIPHFMAQQYLNISDFCINLRYPTAGETSRSVLQDMASQKPVIVSNVGWFAELPNDACLKVDVNESEEETLLQYMIALSVNPDLKKTIGENARDYVSKEHEPNRVAYDYYSFMKNIFEGNEYVINMISGRLDDLNIDEDDVLIIQHIVEKIKDILQ
jgi:glycosyltransferase involved in cell wall biosynthesis